MQAGRLIAAVKHGIRLAAGRERVAVTAKYDKSSNSVQPHRQFDRCEIAKPGDSQSMPNFVQHHAQEIPFVHRHRCGAQFRLRIHPVVGVHKIGVETQLDVKAVEKRPGIFAGSNSSQRAGFPHVLAGTVLIQDSTQREGAAGPHDKRPRIDIRLDRFVGIELSTPHRGRRPDISLKQRIRFEPTASCKRSVRIVDVCNIERNRGQHVAREHQSHGNRTAPFATRHNR